MTFSEVMALQIGDVIIFPTGDYAEVRSTNNVDQTLTLFMLGGDTTTACGDLPAELVDADTLIICPWADAVPAELAPPDLPRIMRGKKSGKERRPLQPRGIGPTMMPEATFINPLVVPSQVPVASSQATGPAQQDFEPQVPPDSTYVISTVQSPPIETKTQIPVPPPDEIIP